MINPNTVFRKSELGNAEIATRKLGLRAELRRLLIMIDGRTPVSRLAAVVRPAEVTDLLNELIAQNLIDASDGAPLASAPSSAPSGTSATDGAGLPTPEQFRAARQAGVRHLNDTLGPSAESFAMKLERARDPQELREVVAQIKASLERLSGPAAAQRFLDAVRTAAKQ